MMERYEEKALLGYICALLKERNIHRYLGSNFWEWVADNQLLFGFSGVAEVDEIQQLTRRRGSETGNREVLQKKGVAFLHKALETRLQSLRSPRVSSLEKTIRAVVELFQLKQDESAVLGLLVRSKKYACLKELTQVLAGGRRGSYGSLDYLELCSRMVGMPEAVVAATVGKQGRLSQCAMIEYESYMDRFELNRRMSHVINQSAKLKTVADVTEYLTGPVQRASLKWEDFEHLGDDRELLAKIVGQAVKSGEPGVNIMLYGAPGSGKTEFCRSLAAKLQLNLYAVAEVDVNNDEPSRQERLQSLRLLQTVLAGNSGSCIVLDEAEDVFGNEKTPKAQSKVYMNRQLETNPVPVFWLTNSTQQIDQAMIRRMTYCLHFSGLPEDIRLQMSLRECEKQRITVNPEVIAGIAADFKPSPALFSNAVRAARLAGGGESEIRNVIEHVGALLNVTRRSTLDQQYSAGFSLELLNTDIDLTKLSVGLKRKGRLDFSFCLSGYPGTGKSEFARWLASQLGLPILMKRASSLSSKWVGETEKNIAAAFAEAQKNKQILVFDEADSFLHSRREARASWEVTQVNEMLTWMERHPYPFICTTNFDEKIDEAAFRRFTFKVRFDYLNTHQVQLAFRQFFSTEAPQEALRIPMLSPSDFAVVKKKLEFIDEVDENRIVTMLKQETAVKTGASSHHSIGFMAR